MTELYKYCFGRRNQFMEQTLNLNALKSLRYVTQADSIDKHHSPKEMSQDE